MSPPSQKAPICRFLEPSHWLDLLAYHQERGTEGYFGERDLTDLKNGSAGAIWLDEVGADLNRQLALAWEKLAPGGFLGGPSWGTGLLEDGRYALNTRASIERFRNHHDDISERILTSGEHPGWMFFKRAVPQERVLLISGCDQIQMTFFGSHTQQNHAHYAAQHGYEARWHCFDPTVDGSERAELIWAKLRVVEEALREGCWDQVWWLDADSAFVNLERKLDHFLHPRWDVVFGEFQDAGRVMYSTGVFGSRPGAAPLLAHARTRDSENEESALVEATIARPDLWQRAQLLEHKLFNGVFGWNIAESDPEQNLICHMVGRSNRHRQFLFKALNRALGILS